MMMIHTVAAGGGSILSFDGARMRVGPESAGADPGPASYGRGGPLAVTDANVVTGRLRPEFFPAIFGPGGDRPLDAEAARRGFAELAERIGRAPEAVAEGFLRIAVESMANAIKTISVQRGYDVSGYCLTVFGGAGAQHACAIADTLGMKVCLVHPMASLLSAYGMGLADIRATRTQALEVALDAEGRMAAAALLDALGSDAEMEVAAQGVAAAADPAGAGAAGEGEGDGHGAAGAVRGGGGGAARRFRRRTGRGSASIRGRPRSSSRRRRRRRSGGRRI